MNFLYASTVNARRKLACTVAALVLFSLVAILWYQKYQRRVLAKAWVSKVLAQPPSKLEFTSFALRIEGGMDVDIEALPYVEEAWRSGVGGENRILVFHLLRKLNHLVYDNPGFYRSVLLSEPKTSMARLEAFQLLFWKTPLEERPRLTIEAMVGSPPDIQRAMAHRLDGGINGISEPRAAFHAFQKLLSSEDQELVTVGIIGLEGCNLAGLSDRLLPKSGWDEERATFKQIASDGPTEQAKKVATRWIR